MNINLSKEEHDLILNLRKQKAVKTRPLPKEMDKHGWDIMIQVCEDYLNFIESEEYHEDASENDREWFYETMFSVIYGPKAFEYINNLLKDR